MKLSQLSISPYRLNFPETGDLSSHIFWRVWIDDTLVTQQCDPLDFIYRIPILKHITPYYHLGATIEMSYMEMLRFGNYIVAIGAFEGTDIGALRFLTKPILDNKYILIFEFEHYMAQVQNALLQDPLPDFTDEELEERMQSKYFYFPPYRFREYCWLTSGILSEKTAIHRNLPNENDPTGAKLLASIQDAIDTLAELRHVESPKDQIELRIGLDEAEFTEAIWRVGRVDGQFAILFEQHPYFPLWLQSEAFDKVLALEPFAKEL